MEREAWVREYRRLLTAYNKSPNNEQVDVYFAALSTYPSVAISEAVTGAIRDSRGWPSAADLVERARTYLAGHQAARPRCDACHGDMMTQHVCHSASKDLASVCGACGLMHPAFVGGFWYARPCSQCHPTARRPEAA